MEATRVDCSGVTWDTSSRMVRNIIHVYFIYITNERCSTEKKRERDVTVTFC